MRGGRGGGQGPRRWVSRWGPLVAWMALMFALSSQPTLPSVPEAALDRILKGGAHALEYAILAVVAIRAFEGSLPSSSRQRQLAAGVFCVLYAVSDEWHQMYVPGRVADWADVLADLAGIVLGLWMAGQQWTLQLLLRLEGLVRGALKG